MKIADLTDEHKARILDWLLAPQTGREDRARTIDRGANKDGMGLRALYTFRVWGSAEEFYKKVQEQMNEGT